MNSWSGLDHTNPQASLREYIETDVKDSDVEARVLSAAGRVIGPPDRSFREIELASVGTGGECVVKWANCGSRSIASIDCTVEFAVELWPEHGMMGDYAKSLFEGGGDAAENGLLVVMCGIPGAGKSTLAANLAEDLNAVHFDFAKECKRLLGGWPRVTSDYVKCGRHLEGPLYEYVNHGGKVIYDTTAITKRMREHHLRGVRGTAQAIVVWCKCPPAEARRRLIRFRPKASPDLRHGITRTSLRLVRTFDDFVTDFEPPHTSYSIQTDRNAPNDVAQTVSKLVQ